MAAITLTPNCPVARTQGSVGTTLQQFTLPPNCKGVRIYGSAAAWLQFSGTDGAAVTSADAAPIPATTWTPFALAPNPTGAARSIYVAAQTGTATISIVAE